MYYLTLEEAAKFISPITATTEKIIQRLRDPKDGELPLFPSILFPEPILMYRSRSKKKGECAEGSLAGPTIFTPKAWLKPARSEVVLGGYFQILNIGDAEWDDEGYIDLSSPGVALVDENAGGRIDSFYQPVELLRKHVFELLFSSDELKADMALRGIDTPDALDENKPLATLAVESTLQRAREMEQEACERLKREGWTREDIAQKLKEMFPRLSDARIGKLITEVPEIFVVHETYRGRGRTLLGKK